MLKHGDITDKITKAFYRVYNTLGYGFLEKVYRKALVLEMRQQGLVVQPEGPITVYYMGQVVGEYYTDMLVSACVIVEVKSAEQLCDEHHAQLLNYLKATGIEVGLLLNFGPKPEMKRKILDRDVASAIPSGV